MDTVIQTKVTSIDLQKRIKQHLEELAQATDQARASEEMVRYLDFCSKFHKYSVTNVWLIMLACPTASMVAGFQKWKSLKRFIRKGEKAIWILAPILYKETDSSGKEIDHIFGFKIVPVFDIGQTIGEPLPDTPNWKSLSKNIELNESLVAFANAKGISVTFKELSGSIQGVSKGGEIEIDTNAGTKTLIHELAHELMHHEDNCATDRSIKELEAESVAYVVSKYFGLEGLQSPNYIVLHGLNGQDFVSSLANIQRVSSEIINALDNSKL